MFTATVSPTWMIAVVQRALIPRRREIRRTRSRNSDTVKTWTLSVPRANHGEFTAPASLAVDAADHLGAAFLAAAEAAADRVAVATPDRDISYNELRSLSLSLRDRLRADSGFHVGDRVLMWMPNGVEYIAAFYGVLLAGGIVVPTPPDLEAGRLRQVLAASGARRILTIDRVLRRRPSPSAEVPRPILLEPVRAPDRWDWNSLPAGDEPAAIFFTSGSTGEPKGVTLSHRNLLANAASIAEYLEIRSDERALAALPFYHAFGNSILQTHLLRGASLVLDGSLTFPETILEAIERHRATSLSGVPDFFRTLLSRTSFGERELPSLRTLAVAGGRLDPDQASVLAFRAAPARLFVMYGQTEASARLSYLHPDDQEERFGSIGRGIPGVRLEVVDEQGEPVRVGEIGEIRARGENIMRGYWRDPAGTATVLRDGWLHTGDLATVDEDGFIYPKGRRAGFVKIAGYRVHPAEIEGFIRREANLLEAVVVPYQSEAGTRLALFAQAWDLDGAPTSEELRLLCARALPRYQIPEYIEILQRYPLTNSYKPDHQALRRRAECAAATSPME